MLLTRALLRDHAEERRAWEEERRYLIRTICMLASRSLPEDAATERLPVLTNTYADNND